jgi:hypothetical protein
MLLPSILSLASPHVRATGWWVSATRPRLQNGGWQLRAGNQIAPNTFITPIVRHLLASLCGKGCRHLEGASPVRKRGSGEIKSLYGAPRSFVP